MKPVIALQRECVAADAYSSGGSGGGGGGGGSGGGGGAEMPTSGEGQLAMLLLNHHSHPSHSLLWFDLRFPSTISHTLTIPPPPTPPPPPAPPHPQCRALLALFPLDSAAHVVVGVDSSAVVNTYRPSHTAAAFIHQGHRFDASCITALTCHPRRGLVLSGDDTGQLHAWKQASI